MAGENLDIFGPCESEVESGGYLHTWRSPGHTVVLGLDIDVGQVSSRALHMPVVDVIEIRAATPLVLEHA